MGVEARCQPSKSTAHPRHMKRQPFLFNSCPRHGRCHCHHHHHLHCRRQLRCHRQCRCHCNCPLPLLLPLAIAVTVSVNHHHCYLCCLAVSYRCRQRPCHRTLPSLSPPAIAIAISIGYHHHHAVGHFQELLPWRGKNCIQPIEAKNTYHILLCSDSGRCIDQSRMTDQVSSSDGQHQRWVASVEQ
jgi:hypothetical protein